MRVRSPRSLTPLRAVSARLEQSCDQRAPHPIRPAVRRPTLLVHQEAVLVGVTEGEDDGGRVVGREALAQRAALGQDARGDAVVAQPLLGALLLERGDPGVESGRLADHDVATRSTMTGTHRGRFMIGPLAALPPTGKQIAVPHMHFFRYKNGRVVDLWHVWDVTKLMRQLGAPAPDTKVGQAA